MVSVYRDMVSVCRYFFNRWLCPRYHYGLRLLRFITVMVVQPLSGWQLIAHFLILGIRKSLYRMPIPVASTHIYIVKVASELGYGEA